MQQCQVWAISRPQAKGIHQELSPWDSLESCLEEPIERFSKGVEDELQKSGSLSSAPLSWPRHVQWEDLSRESSAKAFPRYPGKEAGNLKGLCCYLSSSQGTHQSPETSCLVEAETHGEAGCRSGPLLGLQVTMPLRDGGCQGHSSKTIRG